MFNSKMPTDHKDDVEVPVYGKRLFIKVVLILGFPTIGYFIAQDVLAGRYFTALLLLSMFTALISLFVALRNPADEKEKYTVYRILLTLFIFLFGTYLIYAVGVEKTFNKIYWSYLFPILVFFAMGIKEGLLWTFIFYTCIAYFVFFSDLQFIPLESVKTRFLISFFFVAIMSYVSAYLMRRDQETLLRNQLALRNEIKKHRQTEETLQESEERYRTILENIEDGYYEANLPGDLTFFNDSLCNMLGYTRDEMTGMGNRQYTDEENRKKLYQAFNEVYRTGKPARAFDWEVIRKDGRRVVGEVSVSLIKDSKGNPTGFRGIARDITPRKQIEEALRAEKQKFQTLLENAPFGMALIDKDGAFKYVNAKFIELFGYELNDVPHGRGWFRKAYPDPIYRHQVISTWLNDLKTSVPGEKRARIFEVTCKDGAKKIINFIPVQLETGENLMSMEDITALQKAEQENAALEEQLRQLQKMEAIGQLAGGVAHDFNNLLTVIRGYSQLSLLALEEGAPLRGNLEEIQKAAQKATDLTRHLLAFGRRQIMEMKVFDLNNLLRNLDKMLHRVIGEDIELIYQLDEHLGKVKIDSGQIEQAVLNLAINARDAMPGGGKLTLETTNMEIDKDYVWTHIGSAPGRYVMLSVTDTGVGMPPEVREHAFEPFFTTKEKGKGTGLGLSMVYGIVKQSGGNIWAYSEPGRGSTFKIYLPRVDEPSKEIREKTETAEILRGRETILAVEDEEEVRKLVAQILREQGYAVIEASYGEEAMKLAEVHEGDGIHLLLTDVVMPGMSGRELAENLKRRHPEVKVLYMSGYTDDAIVRHGVLEKEVNYIQKPFTLDSLARKVREALDR